MSMIDYDSRPVTPQVLLIGHRASAVGYSIRDFLSRNGVPYEWVDVDDAERVAAVLPDTRVEPADLPICILPSGVRVSPATVEDVAAGLGMVSAPMLSEYDLTIVGAGPAGLGASVYAASEGLRAVAIESVAPGGQAGTTSMIENYLGFPQGISGSELATRATAQARRFGAEILLARRLTDVTRDGPGYVSTLSDGTSVRSQTLLLAGGVHWRRLEVPGIDELLGSGVYYGAGPSEAVTCNGCRVAIIGGGNSAGQAVSRFSRYAARVTLLVRGSSLEASMSQYLIHQVNKLDNVEVRTNTEVVDLESDGHLQGLVLSSKGSLTRLPADALFVCIGGVPRTTGARKVGLALDAAGYARTGAEFISPAGALDAWTLSRQPLPLETDCQGCSPRATSEADRSSAVLLRSARARCQFPWSTSASPSSGATDMETQSGETGRSGDQPNGGPSEEAKAEFSRPASRQQLRAVADALGLNGITAQVVDSGEEARQTVRSIVPVGAEVYNNTSRTLEIIGVADDIERSGLYQPLRPRLYQMDREMQGREMRQLSAAPDWLVGSVHAVTREGSLLIASASGSQLGPIVSGAGHVVLVIGAQKVVADLDTGIRRINNYCFPLEDARARQAYGVPSGVNNLLVINKAVFTGRITAILVR